MGIFQKIKAAKTKAISAAVNTYSDYSEQKKEEKKLYKETYKKARLNAIKDKANIKAQKITYNAREDAKYRGGRVGRLVSTAGKHLKEQKKKNKGKHPIFNNSQRRGGLRL